MEYSGNKIAKVTTLKLLSLFVSRYTLMFILYDFTVLMSPVHLIEVRHNAALPGMSVPLNISIGHQIFIRIPPP